MTFYEFLKISPNVLNFLAPIFDLSGFMVLYSSAAKKKAQLRKDSNNMINVHFFDSSENKKKRLKALDQDKIGYFLVVCGGLFWAIAAFLEI